MERLHKVSAGFVFAFLCLHFANHFVGLLGVDAHAQFMDAVRLVYRHPIVEMAVLLAFFVQILTGIPLIIEIWTQKKDFIHQLQALSGLVMVIFILGHIASIAAARMIFNLDTNFAFAAATFAPPLTYAAYGFYGAGIFALFTHMGCILYDIFKKVSKPVGWLLLIATLGIGGYTAYLLLMMYSGHLYPITIPEEYLHPHMA
jgi:succinate dehydrogenase/fumarate reductase cytochrome b subunit